MKRSRRKPRTRRLFTVAVDIKRERGMAFYVWAENATEAVESAHMMSGYRRTIMTIDAHPMSLASAKKLGYVSNIEKPIRAGGRA